MTSYVHLPVEHSPQDLAMAGALAMRLESAELYVAWSRTAGSAQPAVPAAVLRRATIRRRPRLVSLLGALRRRPRR